MITRRLSLAFAGLAAATVALPTLALADSHVTVHEVQMLNKDPESGEAMVFEPAIIRAQPGDTIRFVNTDRGHNSVANDDMLPEGAEAWKGKINEEIEVTVEQDGTYGYFCQPHMTVGMVGLILVGDAMVNFEEAREVRQRGRAKARYEELFAEAEEMLAAEGS